jgi:hypothetical protein
MNRIIKFRVWDKDGNGQMFKWEYCRETKLLNDAFDGKQAVAMQFTGLLDKNGKEIYESDIIKTENNYTTVFYNKCAFWLKGFKDFEFDFPLFGLKTILNDGEIIGNIFENPELLNEQK